MIQVDPCTSTSSAAWGAEQSGRFVRLSLYHERVLRWMGELIACHACLHGFSFDPNAAIHGLWLILYNPQQLEKLQVLPIKLRGGLGQRPKTLHQVPQGSTERFHS